MNEKEETIILDEAEDENIPYRYSITSYGADYPVDSLVNRLEKDVIFIPKFQRSYVWNQRIASRFIESLLLGLPVPGIFLSKEQSTGKLLVIDGQQRLRTLQYFYQGLFEGKEFTLKDVQPQFELKTYRALNEEDKIRLDDSIIHATIVKQDEPSEDDSSIFHIFERLNTGGMQLRPQEIRACIYYGPFNKVLSMLNDDDKWRNIFGNKSKRLRDQELILRFFALYFFVDQYERPMKEFLNKYMASNKELKLHNEELLRNKFIPTIEIIERNLGRESFKPERALNVSVYDSIMIGLTRRIDKGPIKNEENFKEKYFSLLKNTEYIAATSTATSDSPTVHRRIELATETFGDLE